MLLTTNLADGSAIPYFLWDEPMTMRELRSRLSAEASEERTRLMAKVMREARFDETMQLVSVDDIVANYPRLRRNLGRRLAFWDFLLTEWRALGLIS